METVPTAAEQQQLVLSFLEIAVGQTAATATQFLQATRWRLDEAVQLFYVGNEDGGVASSSLPPPINERPSGQVNFFGTTSSVPRPPEDEIRPPLPVKRETLYGDMPLFRPVDAFRNFDEGSKRSAVWESDESAPSTSNGSRDNLASLYSPPFALMYQGPFEQAKVEASVQGKWLLMNIQSNEEFSSHMLNRDTWSNEAMAQTIHSNFIFFQVLHDTSEGKKVCTYYNLTTLPAVLVIDPITGQKMRGWSNMIQPERLLEELLPFLDKGPNEHHAILPQKRPRVTHNSALNNILDKEVEDDEALMRAIAASLEDGKGASWPPVIDDEPKPEKDSETSLNGEMIYPPLPEEPKSSRELCKIAIRLPDGRRIRRNFLPTDSTKLLWSLCSSQLADGQKRPFHFAEAIPGTLKSLEYANNLTFEEAGLSNKMITLILD
ncbi:plant UBX domain-containing protein 7-like [Musa acuminata AAA Group]|uniref:plant UBX domain-containing protein 7-like n=1 Tax=Musa acuminata AAA Group TaxID=214697 RepID=UPI0031D6405E